MATTADFRNGLCIKLHGQHYVIRSFQHVKPGKGGAFVRTKLKGIPNGRVIEHTFTAGVKITTTRIERKSFQYLYKSGQGYHFMEEANYEIVVLDAGFVGKVNLLKAGQHVDLLINQEGGQLLSCELPPSVLLKVVETDKGVRGNTTQKAMKPATLESGAVVQVPLFIQTGDLLKIETEHGTYLSRDSS